MFIKILAAASSGGSALEGGIIFFTAVIVVVVLVTVAVVPSLRAKVTSTTRTANKATVGPRPKSKIGKWFIG